MKFNMFSKNNESVSSGEHTANKKNLSIYVNRNNSRHAIVKNDMVQKSLNYTLIGAISMNGFIGF